MKLNKIKLKWKIFAYMLILSLIIVLIFVFFQILMLETFYKNYKINSVSKTFEQVETVVKNDNDNLNNNRQLMDLANQEEASILILDNNGDISVKYGMSEIENKLREDDIYQDIINQAPKNKIFYITFSTNFGPMPHPSTLNVIIIDSSKQFKKISHDSSIICGKFVTYNGDNCLLIVESRLTPVTPAVATLKNQLIYISIIVIILTIIFSLFIASSISRPLKQMTLSANKLASGKRDIEFVGKGFNEIDELNKTLNYAVAELNKTDTLQKELLANISHDLKTPLTLIGGYAEMMIDMPEENTPENLKLIVEEVNRLNILVNDLLALTRLQAGTETFNMECYDVTQSVIDIVKRQKLLLEPKGFDINFAYDKHVNIMADAHKIEQVFYNFISNAVNYSKDIKKIEIKQIIDNNKVRFEVIDFGIGISEEDLKIIWNRYYRIDKTHKRSNKGSGLGLSIVKEILEYHHYEYGTNSKINEGSTFYFIAEIKE